MKKNIFLIVVLFIIGFSACEEKKNPYQEEVAQAIAKVQQKYAPDKRVALFQVESVATKNSIVLRGESNLPSAKKELLQSLEGKKYAVTDSIMMLPSAALDGKTYGVVNLSACNIRSKPKNSAELGTQSTLGTVLRVHKKQGNWYLIQTPDDYFGWLDADGFTLMTKTEYEAWKKSDKVVYLRDFGFSYIEDSDTTLRVSDLLEGNILKLAGIAGDYTKVAYPDGREAYILTTDVMNYKEWLMSREPNAENILAKAKDLLGRPYLWGGTSGKGMDCSGFTKTVFYLNGVVIPRDASQQVHAGIAVETDTTDWKNLQAGDLLFFGRQATPEKKERITHVAIYMGEGKIIHSAGTVKIESLKKGDSDFNAERVKTFVRAKRYLNHFKGDLLSPLNISPHYAIKK